MTDEQFAFKLLKGFTWNDVDELYERGYLINMDYEPQMGGTSYTVAKEFFLGGKQWKRNEVLEL